MSRRGLEVEVEKLLTGDGLGDLEAEIKDFEILEAVEKRLGFVRVLEAAGAWMKVGDGKNQSLLQGGDGPASESRDMDGNNRVL